MTMLLAIPWEKRSKYLQKKLICLGVGCRVPAAARTNTKAGVSDHLHSQMRKPRLSKVMGPAHSPTANRRLSPI